MPQPDTFTDLDDLAAKGPSHTLWKQSATVWTYPGAPLPPGDNPNVSNLRLPLDYVSHARVQAALDAGTWQAVRVALNGSALGIVRCGGERTGAPGPQTFGTVDLMINGEPALP